MIKPNIIFVAKYKVDGVDSYASLQECYDYISDKKILGIDIETTRKDQKRVEKKSEVYRGGLDPYLSNIVMLQIGNFEKIFVIDVRDFTNEEMKPITDFLNWNESLLLVGVNLKFESKHLKLKYGINFKRISDCMIQEMCLYNGLKRSFSLAGMAKNYLGVKEVSDFNLFEMGSHVTLDDEHLQDNEHLITPFEIANEEQIDKSTRLQFITIGTKPFTARQILYGADDILYPLLIAERQMLGRKLDNGSIYNPKKLFRLENNMTLVTADMELNGMPFLEEVWLKIEKEKKEEYDYRLNELNSYIENFYPKFVEEPNLFNFKRRCKIEWGSSKQVIELFRFLDMCPEEFSKQTRRKEYTVGAEALKKIIPNDLKDNYLYQKWIGFEKDEQGNYIEDHYRLILAYLLLKRSEQAITTFGKDWIKYVHPITGRVHSSFRQILNSGRMASSRPNVNQIPKGVYRDAFGIPKGTIIAADFSNQEMRTVACLAGEETMLQVFTTGHPVYDDDLHMATADSMNKALHPNADHLPIKGSPEFTKEIGKKRDNAKIVNFGIIYGKEAKGFAEDFGMSVEDSEDFIQTYFKAYPKLEGFMKKQAFETFKNNYITIDKIVDRRWFSDLFDQMNEFNARAREYYPEDYFTNKMPKEEKEAIKEELKVSHPELKSIWRNFFGIRGSIQRKSTNFAVQGTSASETKTALIMFRNKIISENRSDVMLINSIHDEILVETTRDLGDAQEYSDLLRDCMVSGANVFLEPPIMKSVPEMGSVWIH